MKDILLSLSAILVLFSACSKQEQELPENKKVFKLSIGKILTDTSSVDDWQHVIAGAGEIEFTPVTGDSLTLSPVKDTIAFKDVAGFNKTLIEGNYNIKIKTLSTSLVDTFIRFDAELDNFQLNANKALNFSASTADGIITIAKDFVYDNTVPKITLPDSTIHEFGLKNNHFYLYVKGGTTGKVKFIGRPNEDVFLKSLTIEASTRYNLVARIDSSDQSKLSFIPRNHSSSPILK